MCVCVLFNKCKNESTTLVNGKPEETGAAGPTGKERLEEELFMFVARSSPVSGSPGLLVCIRSDSAPFSQREAE